jgi:hypothetical protein
VLIFLAGDSSVSMSMPAPTSLVPTALSSRLPVHYRASSAVLPHFSPSSSPAGLLSVDSAFQSVVIPDVPYVLGPACSLVTGYPTPSGRFVSSPAVSNICMTCAIVKCFYAFSNLALQCFLYRLLMVNKRWSIVVEGWSFTPSSVKEPEVCSSHLLCCFSLLFIF